MASNNSSKLATYGLLALKVIFGLIFIAAAAAKLSGQPRMVEEFGKVGLGDGFCYVTGLIELVGGAMLLYPKTSRFGAPLLLCVSIGACIAQATRIHQDVYHTFVFIAVTGLLTWNAWKPAR